VPQNTWFCCYINLNYFPSGKLAVGASTWQCHRCDRSFSNRSGRSHPKRTVHGSTAAGCMSATEVERYRKRHRRWERNRYHRLVTLSIMNTVVAAVVRRGRTEALLRRQKDPLVLLAFELLQPRHSSFSYIVEPSSFCGTATRPSRSPGGERRDRMVHKRPSAASGRNGGRRDSSSLSGVINSWLPSVRPSASVSPLLSGACSSAEVMAPSSASKLANTVHEKQDINT
jgi:hypothetical protein